MLLRSISKLNVQYIFDVIVDKLLICVNKFNEYTCFIMASLGFYMIQMHTFTFETMQCI